VVLESGGENRLGGGHAYRRRFRVSEGTRRVAVFEVRPQENKAPGAGVSRRREAGTIRYRCRAAAG